MRRAAHTDSVPICTHLTDWGEPSDELAAISSGATPEERMLRVVRWFIMTLKVSEATLRWKQLGVVFI
jgi:hypothetical protein